MKPLLSFTQNKLPNFLHRSPLRGFTKIRRSSAKPYFLDSQVIYNHSHDMMQDAQFEKKGLLLFPVAGAFFYFDYKYTAGFITSSFVVVNLTKVLTRYSLRSIIKSIRYNPFDQQYAIETFNSPEKFLVKAQQVIVSPIDTGSNTNDYLVKLMEQKGDIIWALNLKLLSDNLYEQVSNVEFFDAMIDNDYEQITKYQMSKSGSKGN